jgi:hypothetical protein
MRKDNFSISVHAGMDTLWRILHEKAEHPEDYLPGVEQTKILERYEDGFLRETVTRGMRIVEQVEFRHEGEGRVLVFRLKEHPLMIGEIQYRIIPSSRNMAFPLTPVTLNLVIQWIPRDEAAGAEVQRDLHEAMQRSLELIRDRAEEADREDTGLGYRRMPVNAEESDLPVRH